MADNVHQLQASAEGVVSGDVEGGPLKVEFLGQSFNLADRIGLMPLMRFAQTSKKGTDSNDMEGLAALYTLLRDCIDTTRPQKAVLDAQGRPTVRDGEPVTEDDGPSQWDLFEDHAINTKAEADDLMKVVGDAIALISARPTPRPVDSSAGPQTTSDSSRSTPSLSALPGGREPDPRWAGLQPVGGLARSTG